MTNPSRSSYPDPWAQAARIREEWREAGRDGADRQTQIARVKAARARRAAAVSEARIKAAVDKAVTEALASPGFAESVDQATQDAGGAVSEPQVPERPLHEMSSEEWEAHRSSYWSGRLTPRRPPMTVTGLIAGGRRGDGEA